MREIKFRGKCSQSNDWVYGDLIHGVGFKKGNMYILPDKTNLAYVKHCDPLDGVNVIPESVGQFTGLKDKNGVEIYQHDYDENGLMVDWCDECAGWQFFQIDIPSKDIICCQNCDGSFMLRDHLPDFTIIGNIHDKTPNNGK